MCPIPTAQALSAGDQSSSLTLADDRTAFDVIRFMRLRLARHILLHSRMESWASMNAPLSRRSVPLLIPPTLSVGEAGHNQRMTPATCRGVQVISSPI